MRDEQKVQNQLIFGVFRGLTFFFHWYIYKKNVRLTHQQQLQKQQCWFYQVFNM